MNITEKQLFDLIKYRGLGYTQQEIADKLSLSRKTIENNLHRLKEESKGYNSIEEAYINIVFNDNNSFIRSVLSSKIK